MISNYPAWQNGNFCQVADLKISILDLGLIHSDATYDVLSIHAARAVMLDQHLDRFENSCQGWRIPLNYDRLQLKNVIGELYRRSGLQDALIWLAITRGIPNSGNPRDLANCATNLMIYIKPYYGFNPGNSCKLCIADNIRVPNQAINQEFKNWAWQDLTQAQWQALDQGFDTAVLLSQDGYITEGPGFNVGCIIGDKIVAPEHNRLSGVSMQLIQKLCQEHNIKFQFKNITKNEILTADDVFITSTAGHMIPVTQIDRVQIVTGSLQNHMHSLIKQSFLLDDYSVAV